MDIIFNVIPRLAWSLSGKYREYFLIILLKLWWFVLTRRLFSFTNAFPVKFIFNQAAFFIVLRYSMDIAVLREIYLDKEYEWFPNGEPKTIVDLGAHFGDTALYYHALFPKANIIAVEPSPETYARLVENTKHIPQITPVQAAISNTDGDIFLNIMPSSLGNSLTQRKGFTDSIKVPSMRLVTLLEKSGFQKVDLLKFDIEGAEFAVFSDRENTHFASAYIGEVHEDLADQRIDDFKIFFANRTIAVQQLHNKKRYLVKII